MTPGQVIALVRDGVVVATVLIILWLVYHGGEDRVKASDLKALQKEIRAQADIAEGWHREASDANNKLNQTLASINNTPIVVHDWVRHDCAKSSVLPGAPGQASPPRSDPPGVQPEHGGDAESDRLDSIVAEYKARWGAELATCQSFLDQWPQ